MLSGKNPLREKDLSDMRDQARHRPLETSRRNVLIGGAAMAAALPMRSLADQTSPASASAQHADNQGETRMNMITTKDKRQSLGYETARRVLARWRLTADAWDAQISSRI
jgi:hypothetical protein